MHRMAVLRWPPHDAPDHRGAGGTGAASLDPLRPVPLRPAPSRPVHGIAADPSASGWSRTLLGLSGLSEEVRRIGRSPITGTEIRLPLVCPKTGRKGSS